MELNLVKFWLTAENCLSGDTVYGQFSIYLWTVFNLFMDDFQLTNA